MGINICWCLQASCNHTHRWSLFIYLGQYVKKHVVQANPRTQNTSRDRISPVNYELVKIVFRITTSLIRSKFSYTGFRPSVPFSDTQYPQKNSTFLHLKLSFRYQIESTSKELLTHPRATSSRNSHRGGPPHFKRNEQIFCRHQLLSE